jgi:hypothetical protein
MDQSFAREVSAGAVAVATVGERLGGVRRRWFAGRTAELELLRGALEARVPPFNVLWVHGVGGVGKTTLLGALAAIALIGLGASILLPANPEQ